MSFDRWSKKAAHFRPSQLGEMSKQPEIRHKICTLKVNSDGVEKGGAAFTVALGNNTLLGINNCKYHTCTTIAVMFHRRKNGLSKNDRVDNFCYRKNLSVYYSL